MSEELREAIARWLFAEIRYDPVHPLDWAELWDWPRAGWLAKADALLSGPLAPLLAAQAAVERVEGIAKVWDGIADMWRDSAEHPAAAPRAREMARGEEFDFRERARVLRAALDGTS